MYVVSDQFWFSFLLQISKMYNNLRRLSLLATIAMFFVGRLPSVHATCCQWLILEPRFIVSSLKFAHYKTISKTNFHRWKHIEHFIRSYNTTFFFFFFFLHLPKTTQVNVFIAWTVIMISPRSWIADIRPPTKTDGFLKRLGKSVTKVSFVSDTNLVSRYNVN